MADEVLLAETDGVDRTTAVTFQSSTTEDTEENAESTMTAHHSFVHSCISAFAFRCHERA